MAVESKNKPQNDIELTSDAAADQGVKIPKAKLKSDVKNTIIYLIYLTCYSLGYGTFYVGKTLRGYTGRILSAIYGFIILIWKEIRRVLRRYAIRSHLPIAEIKSSAAGIAEAYRKARAKGLRGMLFFYVKAALDVALQFFKTLVSSVNYYCPFIAAVIFITVVSIGTHLSFGLKVEYNGEVIGYITDESVFDKADNQMLGRIVYEEYKQPTDKIPTFSIAVIKNKELTSVNDLTNALIKASGNELEEAYGLYVADTFLGADTDRTRIAALLESILAKYRTGVENETVQFVKTVEIREGLYPLTSVVGIDSISSAVTSEEAQQQVYTVQKGDAPTLIAQKNNVPYAELKALNPGIESKLMIGQEVLVARSVPFLGVQVIRQETYQEDVAFKVEQTQDANKLQGYVKIKQTGQKGVNEISAQVTYVDGVESSRKIMATNVVKEPVNEVVIVGGQKPLAQMPASAMSTSTGFIWPVDGGGYVSMGFRGYSGHTGMDIAGRPSGTAIRAAASGTVVMVLNQSTGYGRHLMIDHGGGVQTLYAHCSSINVKVGDWVEQGQLIAAMGRTGRATGVHLHFEVRINGQYMNPAKYVGLK